MIQDFAPADVFAVSDSTGKTAEQIVNSALVQFSGVRVRVVRRANVHTPELVRNVVEEAVGRKALILHTLVRSDLRRLMLEECRLRGVDTMDLMGPVLDRLSVHLHRAPREEPGLYHHLQEGKAREIEAVEFAFRHDDGQNSDDIDRAEIVLVGVSRTMKTPTMLYLAYHGWFCANVPLVPELALPGPLAALPEARVFCLDTTDARLVELRRSRATAFRIPEVPYAGLEQVRRELAYARELCRSYGWRRIDTTGRSVEEVAREILVMRTAATTVRPAPPP